LKNPVEKYMAEDGEFGLDDPKLDHNLDNDGHDDDDDEQEVDGTQPFQPTEASTPYHGGEQHEMQTMHHEQSGLPDTCYEETPLLDDFSHPEDKKSKLKKALDYIKKLFPMANFEKIDPISFSKKGK